MEAAGLPLLKAHQNQFQMKMWRELAQKLAIPLLSAAAGGGGIGMQIVDKKSNSPVP